MNYVLFNYPTTVYFPEAEYTEEELINRIHFLDRRFLAEIESNPNVPDILELYRLVQELGQDMLDRLREGIAAEEARAAEVEADEEAFYAALEIPVIEISYDEEEEDIDIDNLDLNHDSDDEDIEPSVIRILTEYEEEQYTHIVRDITDEEHDQYLKDNYSPYSDEDMSDEDC